MKAHSRVMGLPKTRSSYRLMFLGIIVGLIPIHGLAQEKKRDTFESRIVVVWEALHNKILQMAKDLPEEQYDWRPHPESRSMLEEFRHVTVGLEMSSAMLKGVSFDYSTRVRADSSKPRLRDSVVGEMEAAILTSFPLVKEMPNTTLVWWIGHQSEHYGKLVSNYRMIGIVPPASRL